jgi:dsDNA-specific endonuclease/ATPase MutS2
VTEEHAPAAGPETPVEVEISDVIDLHPFQPREAADVVRSSLDAAYEAGYRSVRIIHGRGCGVQRRTVRLILGNDPRVLSVRDAPVEAGGWGATLVDLD